MPHRETSHNLFIYGDEHPINTRHALSLFTIAAEQQRCQLSEAIVMSSPLG